MLFTRRVLFSGRMGLLITMKLVLVNLLGTVIQEQPPTTGPTALVVWMLTCIVFVTGAIAAYAVLLWRKLPQSGKKGSRKVSSRRDSANEGNKKFGLPSLSGDSKNNSNNLDSQCLVFFPVAFLLFNLIYWPLIIANDLELEGHSHWNTNTLKQPVEICQFCALWDCSQRDMPWLHLQATQADSLCLAFCL